MPVLIGIIVCVFLIILRELEKSDTRRILDKAKDMSFINKGLEYYQRKQQLNREFNMTREEEIKQAIENNLDVSAYTPKDGELLKETFYIGAKWADNHPKSHWINVKDDLPCNHKELISETPKLIHSKNVLTTKNVLVILTYNIGKLVSMVYINNKWEWDCVFKDEIVFWMPISELPKD